MLRRMAKRRKRMWRIWTFPFDSPYDRRIGKHGVNIEDRSPRGRTCSDVYITVRKLCAGRAKL